MSLKSTIKKNCPENLLPVLKAAYHITAWPFRTLRRLARAKIVARRALKFLPYYQDELSRGILSDRLEYLRTGDVNPFIRRAEKEGWKFSWFYAIDGIPDYSYGKNSRTEYSDILVVYDKEGRDLNYTKKLLTIMYGSDSFKCIQQEEFFKYSRIIKSFLIIPVMEGITRPVSIREDEQYFDVFSPLNDEIIIDAGAYDGATAIQFLEWGKGKVKKIYSFEFDPENAAKCEDNLKSYGDKITVIKKGTWDKDEVMHVITSGTPGSSVSIEGSSEVQLTTIDSVVKDEHVTFIKMDVEGAELKSLMGAKNTIIKNRPRLAICIYHKPEDLYKIPAYILSLVPEYKFYLRHYSSNQWETVLYAYCD